MSMISGPGCNAGEILAALPTFGIVPDEVLADTSFLHDTKSLLANMLARPMAAVIMAEAAR